MIEKNLTAATADEKIKQLYETAFPEDEQIPWKDLMRLVEEMPLDFTAYYDGEEFIGFTIVYPRKSINWFWYFAVCEELRGKGYGQKILTQMIEHYKAQSFVLDMESPTQVSENIDQRKRRQNFYLRNGFRDTNVYSTYNDITMTIMMRGEGTFTMKDWDDIIHELQQFWWPDDIEEESCGSLPDCYLSRLKSFLLSPLHHALSTRKMTRKTMTMIIMLPISPINHTFRFQNTFTIGMF